MHGACRNASAPSVCEERVDVVVIRSPQRLDTKVPGGSRPGTVTVEMLKNPSRGRRFPDVLREVADSQSAACTETSSAHRLSRLVRRQSHMMRPADALRALSRYAYPATLVSVASALQAAVPVSLTGPVSHLRAQRQAGV